MWTLAGYLAQNGQPDNSGSKPEISRQDALKLRQELMADPEWRAKVASGDPEALDDLHELSVFMLGPEAGEWGGNIPQGLPE